MNKRSRRARRRFHFSPTIIYILIGCFILGIGYFSWHNISRLVLTPASINLLLEEATDDVVITQTPGQAESGTGVTVTDKKSGNRLTLRTRPGQDMTEVIIAATTAVGVPTDDHGTPVSDEQKEKSCTDIGKVWDSNSKVCTNQNSDAAKADGGRVPDETFPVDSSYATPSVVGTSCAGAFTTIPAGNWVPTGKAVTNSDGSEGRECAYCSGIPSSSSTNSQSTNDTGYATSSDGKLVTQSCGDALRDDPQHVIMPPDPGPEYWTQSDGTVGVKPPAPCSTGSGPIPSGQISGDSVCFDGKIIKTTELASTSLSYCLANDINIDDCSAYTNDLVGCEGNTTLDFNTGQCVVPVAVAPTTPTGQPPGTIVTSQSACSSGIGNPIPETPNKYRCVERVGATVTQPSQCQSGMASTDSNGKLRCSSACVAGPNLQDRSGNSYFTCDEGKQVYNTCGPDAVYMSKSGSGRCVANTTGSLVEAPPAEPTLSDPVPLTPTEADLNNSSSLRENGDWCYGNSESCNSGYCQKNTGVFGFDILAPDKCAPNPKAATTTTTTTPLSTAINSNPQPNPTTVNPPTTPRQPATQKPPTTQPQSGQPAGLTSGTGLTCTRIGNSYCNGESMYKLYEWYKGQPDAWWYGNDGEFSEGDFLALMLMYESRGGGEELLNAITTASSNQLWGDAEGGRDPYCNSQSNCTAGVFNFIGAYMQSAVVRYNNLVTKGSPQSVDDGKSEFTQYFQDGTAHDIAARTIYNQSPKKIDLNAPTDWGAFDSALGGDPDVVGLQGAANSGRTGSTDPCGIYYSRNGEVVYSFNQKAAWESGACR